MGLRFLFTFLVSIFVLTNSFGQIKINEIMASNDQTIADEQGDYDDWIEIINTGSVSVNFGGMYVSDDPDNLTKWQIPTNASASTTIAPGQFLLIWFDGDVTDGALHVDMKLSASGEFAILTASDGITEIDRVEFGEQQTDISWAATIDGASTFSFQAPTPRASNTGEVVKTPAEAPTFTLETGFYSGSHVIGLATVSEGTEIRYTLDATVPTATSALYVGPITIDSSTVIRAIALGGDYASSRVSTNTYIYDDAHTIPVVSFVMDPDSLFSNEAGLFAKGDSAESDFPYRNANFWQEWEYPAHIEFMETNGNIEFEMDAGASIGGNFSRGFNKKSFIINNNEEYGEKRLEYELFPENEYTSYDGFGLRAGGEERSRLLNELMYAINQKWNHHNDMQASRPVVMYINGQYWGIYLLQERKNDDFVESRYGFEDIDMIKDYNGLKDGSWDAYYELVDGLLDLDPSSAAFYDFINSNINLNSFTDHWIYQIYTSHGDPNNLRYWKARNTEGAKWNYISHDFDWWRNLGEDPEEYFGSFKFFLETGTYDFWILGRLMENPTYQKQFLSRLADMLNTAFKPTNLFALIDSIDTAINPEMPRDIARWEEGWVTISGFSKYDMEYIREITESYAIDYPQFIYKEVFDTLGIDTSRIHLSKSIGGKVKVNSEIIETNLASWTGIYFQDIEIGFTPVPSTGYRFAGWLVNGESQASTTENTLSIILTDSNSISIEAQFNQIDEIVVINEINYNSSEDFEMGDWIELYNAGNETIDLFGWTYKDEKDTLAFTIPENTLLGASEYLVLSSDLVAFKTFKPEVDNVIGGVEFGLSGNTDQVRIFNSNGELIDMVSYDDESPWPVEPDGTGYTLELNAFGDDNSLGEHWVSSLSKGGTPGMQNQMVVDAIEDMSSTPRDFILSQNYPNPFNPTTNISFNIPKSGKVELAVFNVLGQKVQTLVENTLNAGAHTVKFDATGLTSGVYFYRLTSGTNIATQKMLLMK